MLRLQSNSFRMLCEVTPQPICVFDSGSLFFLEANEAAREKYGHTRDEFLARKVTDLFPAEEKARVQAFFAVPQGPQQRKESWKQVLPSGQVIDVEMITRAMEFDGRKAIIAVMEDVTEHKKTVEALAGARHDLGTVIENVPIIHFAFDKEGIFTLSEGSGLKGLGRKSGQSVGKSIFDIYKDAPEFTAAARRALAGETFTRVVRVWTRFFEGHFFPKVEKGRLEGVYGVAVDVSERMAAETALQGVEQRLKRVVAAAPIILFALDKEGLFTVSEGRALDGLGLRPGEVVGRSVFDVYRDNPAILEKIRRCLAGETFTSLNEVNGRTFRTHYAPLRDGGGVGGVIGVATDVTDLVLTEGDLDRHRIAMDAAQDGLAILGPDERYAYLNEAHCRVYGYGSSGELVGKSWKILYEPREALRIERKVLPLMRREGRWRGEAVGRKKDGSFFPQEVSLSPLPDGGLVCVVRDISARKKAEEERSLLMGREQSARLEAERSNHSRDEFLAVLSHEMRTPITAMLGWTWLLRSESLDEEARSKALDVIQYNMKLQSQIIEDLLDVSRLITGRLKLDSRPVDLRLPIGAALENIRAAASAKSIRVEEELDSPSGAVRGDPDRLQQIFWNLLSNAVKFTPEGGLIRVSLRREGERLAVRFSDTGPGIGVDFLPYIFDRFRQEEESLTRKFRGLGLGLSLVKQLVEMHGGSVSVESPPGAGTTFTVLLPVGAGSETGENAAGAGGSPQPIGALPKLKGLKVLVVDDEAATRDVSLAMLRHCGAEVRTAQSAKEAFEAFRKFHPDVLVCDISMPVEDGFSLIRRVRSLSPGKGGDVPAVALTSSPKAEDRARALMAGFQLHVSKPLEPVELAAAVGSLSGRLA